MSEERLITASELARLREIASRNYGATFFDFLDSVEGHNYILKSTSALLATIDKLCDALWKRAMEAGARHVESVDQGGIRDTANLRKEIASELRALAKE